MVMAEADVYDTKLLALILERIAVERPDGWNEGTKHLCLDKGYDNPTGLQAVVAQGYQGRIRLTWEEKLDALGWKRYPA